MARGIKGGFLSLLVTGLLTFCLGWWVGVRYDVAAVEAVPAIDFGSTIPARIDLSHESRPKLPDTVFEDAFEIIVKDTAGLVKVWRKFNPSKTFRDYPVQERYAGKAPEKLDFTTCKYGQKYQTVSHEAAKKAANFAGHYVFFHVGCGTSCQYSILVDLTTGNVYAGPEATGGYDIRLDSKLIVVNPPDTSGLYFPCFYCTPAQYIWTGSGFRKGE